MKPKPDLPTWKQKNDKGGTLSKWIYRRSNHLTPSFDIKGSPWDWLDTFFSNKTDWLVAFTRFNLLQNRITGDDPHPKWGGKTQQYKTPKKTSHRGKEFTALGIPIRKLVGDIMWHHAAHASYTLRLTIYWFNRIKKTIHKAQKTRSPGPKIIALGLEKHRKTMGKWGIGREFHGKFLVKLTLGAWK
jgi:hypothetical protein